MTINTEKERREYNFLAYNMQEGEGEGIGGPFYQ